ncbi:hypothetical protein SAMN05216353_102130 [Halobacillus alkaliphilus]|uniref:Uncharacterized protein n=1 Tax=Halobacillus alkaliphilus TaxID=396056 RepID=A0A1I2JST9_9BACI|nr:hypothetical protein SAMN05216353_102130 [Halobacillus alkaliphilus]
MNNSFLVNMYGIIWIFNDIVKLLPEFEGADYPLSFTNWIGGITDLEPLIITLILWPTLITCLIGYFLYKYSKPISIIAMLLIPLIIMYLLISYKVLLSIPLSIIIVLTIHGFKKPEVS